MDSTPTERYAVIRKICIAIVLQTAYVILTYKYVPLPESMMFKASGTMPLMTLNENKCSVIPNPDTTGSYYEPVVMSCDASVIEKYSLVSTTEEQIYSSKNMYRNPDHQNGDETMARHRQDDITSDAHRSDEQIPTDHHQDDQPQTRYHCVLFPGHAYIISKFVYTLRWQLLSASTVLLAIIDVALRRLHTKALDPINGHAEHLVEVKVRILQNTLEQLICNLIGQLVLCTYLTEDSMKIIPIIVSLFVFGRLIFKLGYEQCPSRRTYGFAITYIPTFITYMYCLWCAMT